MTQKDQRRPGEEAPRSEPTRQQRTDNPNPNSSVEQAQRDLRLLAQFLFVHDGGVAELRALQAGTAFRGRIVSGYFDDPDRLVAEAMKLDGLARGIYLTMNPVLPDLLARATNRVEWGAKVTTSDSEIVARHWILIDIDPTRPRGVSATEQEKQAAFDLAKEVCAFLRSQGFPDPVKGDSGNGAHLLYRVDLPTEDGGLITRFLEALAFLFDRENATVDRSVGNAGQLCKAYGTLVCKGDSTEDRPHRRSRLVSVPTELRPVPQELIERVASMGAPEPPAGERASKAFDVAAFLREHGVLVSREGPWKGGQRWVLAACPFNSEHTDQAAYVVQFGNGAIAAGCHHNGCSGLGWQDLRRKLDPSWKGPQEASGSNGSAHQGDEIHFPEPQELPTGLLPVPPFPEDLIPSSFRPWLRDIADRVQCSIEYLAVTLMVVLGAVIGRKVGIRPKRNDDWIVVPNVWGVIVGRPGVLKTPAIQAVLKLLMALERLARDVFDSRQSQYQAEHMVWEREKKKFSREKKAGLEEAQQILASQPKEPVRKRYITNDSTVEKLGELLAENPNGILAFRDELIGLIRSLDKEGNETARAFYLEAWNGTTSFTYDRIGRGTVDIDSAIVSMLGGIQPGPLVSYLVSGLRDGRADDGFIQRLQLMVWPDVPPDWENVDREPDAEAHGTAQETIEALDQLDPTEVGAEQPEDDDGIPFVHFDEEAQEAFDRWREPLERRIRAGAEAPAMESYLAKFRSLIPSLALQIHLAETFACPVGLDALRKATRWGDLLEAHARRVFSAAINPDLAAGLALSMKIRARELEGPFTLRDVYRKGWSGLGCRDDAQRAVQYLLDHDWLVEQEIKTGGKPKVVYLINPGVHELPQASTANTDNSPPDGASGSNGSTDSGSSGHDRDGEAAA